MHFNVNVVLGIENNYLKSVWELLLPRGISERNVPNEDNTINKNTYKNSDIFSSMVKRTKPSLTPYESIGK